MNCPWMKGTKIKQCDAVSSPVVLSGCELETYCSSGNYTQCPVFKSVDKLKGERLNLRNYYMIYSRWVRNSYCDETTKKITKQNKSCKSPSHESCTINREG